MLPRNLTFFRFSKEVADSISTADLNHVLALHAFCEIGPQEFSTSGFSPFMAPDFTLDSGSYEGFALRIAEKLLPSASIAEAVAKKCEVIETLEGRKPSGRERKRLKDEVVNEMLPHAPVRLKTIRGWFDYAEGWLIIDTASRKQAENVLSQLREALGSLPAVPLAPEVSPRVTLTLALGSQDFRVDVMPEYQLTEEAQLRDPATANGARVTFARQDLDTEEVRDQLRTGKQVYRLGLEMEERLTFLLDSDLVVRKFKLTDVVLDEQFEREEFGEQSDFALVTREVSRLCASLARVFKVPRP